MTRFKNNLYTIERRVWKNHELCLIQNEDFTLFSGHHKTKIVEEDLPEWYVFGRYYKMWGFLSTKGITDLRYIPNMWVNHFLKDDCLLISYGGKIEEKAEDKKTVRQEIFEYLDSLPLNIEIEVNGRQFILTHAAPVDLYEQYAYKYNCERDFAVWMRFDRFPVLEDWTVIFGHTPTFHFQFENPMAVWDAESWIGIDCGCMLPDTGDPWSGVLGRLGCLRLEDMKVFYSEEPQYSNVEEMEDL